MEHLAGAVARVGRFPAVSSVLNEHATTLAPYPNPPPPVCSPDAPPWPSAPNPLPCPITHPPPIERAMSKSVFARFARNP